ncbi:MAG: PilZ domain-containing protein [Bradyrhizobium sp.]|nr:MAG: PilZ domain-containing protein [Bradyrhizobium sp.]
MNAAMDMRVNDEAERRRAPRSRCLRKARCIVNKGADVAALVRNISETGAKLTGDAFYRLPEEFDLQIDKGSGEFMLRRARRVWSHRDSIGVTFLEARRIAEAREDETPRFSPD